ncbi:MAG: TIGR01212 family radical SAM protein [Bacteroidales bacterium]|nr:TIGR01212 family radical SAM protein [Bacteroidales bacterium]
MRVQKIALNPGFGCPNRDGSIGTGGCTYCNNKTFSPYYGQQDRHISDQLSEGIEFFGRKYKAQKYIAYFQSYTNTYADISTLRQIYSEALSHPGVVGLAVATRPDCASDSVLDLLAEVSEKAYTTIEFGVESCYNETLSRINRGHNFQTAKDAIQRAAARGLEVCAHLIMYLPGETHEMMMRTAQIMSDLPISILKLHQLQIIKGTPMEKEYLDNPWHLPSVDEYIDFCAQYIRACRQEMIFERFISESPRNMVVAPCWNGIKNFEFTDKLRKAVG